MKVNSNSTHQAALDYCSRGLSITICKGKVPLGKGWQHRTWTAAEIDREFHRGDCLNVGIRLGPDAGIIDIEADSEAEKQAFQELFNGCDVPMTPTFSSRRGIHRLFRWADALAVTGKAVVKFKGLGIRIGADGKAAHSCVPPSVNTDGTVREWRIGLDECEPAALPEAVVKRILAANNPAPPCYSPLTVGNTRDYNRQLRAAQYVNKIPPAIELQGGDNHTFHVACVLVQGFDLTPDEAWPIISVWNRTCQPPWDEEKLRRKLDEANKQTGQRGTLLNSNGHARAAHGESGVVACTKLPEVQLPGGDIKIITAAVRFAELLGNTGRFFTRGGVPVRLIESPGDLRLEPIRPAALCSDLETVARLVSAQPSKRGEQIAAICSETKARLILESAAFRETLPTIHVVSPCPVLTEVDGQLVTVSGFDRATGILAGAIAPHEIELGEAVDLLFGLLGEFRFPMPGDKARALAAIITPGLVSGGLLNGRAPIDLGEADESQSGKGFRNKLTAAIYNSRPRIVTPRAAGGIGGVQESFDSALVSGAAFISLDNFRGRLDLAGLESFLTEDAYQARAAYQSFMTIDPRRVIIMFTSNAAEVTVDLANRSCCTRIQKQPAGYQFAKYPEGDLLAHVLANQPLYLGAVFAVIMEWHRLGKPELETAGHDFRRWARVLGYITENILSAGGLLVGHREAQQRIASPELSWLREVALAVHAARQTSRWLRPRQLLEIIIEAGIDTPGVDSNELDDDAACLKATQSLGRKLDKLFKTGEVLTIDGTTVERREVHDERSRQRKEFAFLPGTPNTPE